MTKEEIHDLVAKSKGYEKNICQIYSIKDGAMAYEDHWRRYGVDSAVQVMSVTKGIMAVLAGIAVDKGFIHSVNQKVLDFFPNYSVKRGERTIYDVTLEHLLTMTAPFKYRSEPWKKVSSSADWATACLDLLGGKDGITGAYRYVTLGLQILSGVLENATGMKCIDFANDNLFVPLGIPAHKTHESHSWDDYRSFMMSRKPKEDEWFADPRGAVTAGWGLTMSARDMAKIGWMLTNDGIFDGNRVLSKEWITRMTTPILQTGDDPSSYYYGYLWYRPRRDGAVFAAIGTGGNLIYVDEGKRLSVGVTGTCKPGIENNIGFVENCVVPLVEGW